MIRKAFVISLFIEASLCPLLSSEYDIISHIVPFTIYFFFLPDLVAQWPSALIAVLSIIINATFIFMSLLGMLKLYKKHGVKYVIILLFITAMIFLCGITISNRLISKARAVKPFSIEACKIEEQYEMICSVSYCVEKIKYNEWYLTGQPFSITEPKYQLGIANGLSYAIPAHFIVLFFMIIYRKSK